MVRTQLERLHHAASSCLMHELFVKLARSDSTGDANKLMAGSATKTGHAYTHRLT